MNNFKKLLVIKNAFTLSEVLITLAVIGVVAAVTLPTLIQKHQKMTWVSQLKSNYSLFSQGFKTMMAEEGVERIDDTSVWQSMGANCYYSYNPKTSNQCKDFFPNLKKYFKITSIEPLTDYTYKYLNDSTVRTVWTGSNNYAIHLSNGAMIWAYTFYKSPYNMRTTAQCQAIKAAGGHMCEVAGGFRIDINGKKGPNIHGRDIFGLYITERGAVVPYYGIEYLTYDKNGNKTQIESTKMQSDGSSSDSDYACKTGNSSIQGWGCTARIIELDNWQMKY